MSITLELSPELEARLRAEASAQHVPVESLAVEKLNGLYSNAHTDDAATRRRAAALAGRGMFAGQMQSTDEFLAARHDEGEADYLAGRERQETRTK